MPYIVLDPSAAQAAPVTTIGAPATAGNAYTLAELYDELMLRLGDRTDVTLTRATRWINSAIADIASGLNLPKLKGGTSFVTTANQSLYLLPENIKTIELVSLADSNDGRKLIELDDRKFRMLVTAEGDPTHYLPLSNMLALWPTPSDAKTVIVDGIFNPSNLSALDSTKRHILGGEWNEGLLRLAKSYAHSALVEPEQAATALNEYITWVRRQNDPNAQNTNTIARFSVPRRERDLHRARINQTDDGAEREEW
jgi:hypothetical protein